MNNRIWQASLHSTLDLNSDTVSINSEFAKILREGLLNSPNNKYYLLTLEAGYEVEIIRVCYVSRDGVMLIKRGQEGTESLVWPAGSIAKAMIKSSVINDLNIDTDQIISNNPETKLSDKGDLILKEF